MNRSKIEWCDHTWNPITGCRHNCPYCYARRMVARFAGDVRLNLMAKKDYSLVPAADGGAGLYILDEPMMNETGSPLVYPFGFEPTYHRYRLNTLDKLKMGNNIFVGAMADVFGEWVPDEWIREIMRECVKRPQHNYLFLTKNPERYLEAESVGILPHSDNIWYGATVTRIQQMEHTAEAFSRLPLRLHTFFSIEPVLEDLADSSYWREALLETEWIILGAQTGGSKDKVIPRLEWIQKIILDADKKRIPVFMKDSLISIASRENMRREFPTELKRKIVSEKMEKKLYGTCARCKVHMRKYEMVTLLARSKRGETPGHCGFMCGKCFKELCGSMGLNVPELEGLKDD